MHNLYVMSEWARAVLWLALIPIGLWNLRETYKLTRPERHEPISFSDLPMKYECCGVPAIDGERHRWVWPFCALRAALLRHEPTPRAAPPRQQRGNMPPGPAMPLVGPPGPASISPPHPRPLSIEDVDARIEDVLRRQRLVR